MAPIAGTSTAASNNTLSWFKQLVPIANPSRGEATIRQFILTQVSQWGYNQTQVDDKGNLLVKIPGRQCPPETETLLFCAHMDSVPPCQGIEPLEDILDGRAIVRSAGQTILGADDKSGIAVLLALLEYLQGNPHVAHSPFDCLFTVEEEIGIFGAFAFDPSTTRATRAYALDGEGALGDIFVAGPTQNNMIFTCRGQAGHAGMAPNGAANAIMMAARLINQLPSGRLSPDTTANIGLIKGGLACNVIPDHVEIRAELRSHNRQTFDQLKAQINETVHQLDNTIKADCPVGGVDVEWIEKYQGFRVADTAPVVNRAQQAANALGFEAPVLTMNIGSDAHALNAQGIPAVVLGMGFHRSHSVGEYIFVDELNQVFDWVLELLTPDTP